MIEDALHVASKMDDIFARMMEDGHNGMDNLMRWLQEAKVVDKSKEAAEKTKKLFSKVKDHKCVTLDEFKEVVNTIAQEQKTTFDQISKTLSEQVPKIMKAMDQDFADMAKEGKNCVENMIRWMQEAKIIENTKEAAEKTKKLFSGVKDQTSVTLDEFKEVVNKIAQEQKTTFDQISSALAEQGSKLMKAFGAAASAFKDSMK